MTITKTNEVNNEMDINTQEELLNKEAQEYEDKYYKGKAISGENIYLSAKAGWTKGMHWLKTIGLDERQIYDQTGNLRPGAEKYINNWKQEEEIKREAYKEIVKERDAFYTEHPDDITFLDKIAGSAVESFTNPVEVATQVGLGVATGGTSLGVRLGTQMAFDIGQAQFEARTYEDRDITPKEVATTAVMSAVPDLIFAGIGRAVKSDMLKPYMDNLHVSGDANINVRKTMDFNDNIGLDKNNTRQRVQTEYNQKVDINNDSYHYTDFDFTGATTYKASDEFKTSKKRFRDSIDDIVILSKEIEGDYYAIKDIIYDKEIELNNNASTVLSRTVNSYKSDIEILKGYDIDKDKAFEYGYKSKDNDYQNIGRMSRKNNGIIEQYAENITPVINDYYNRWKIQKKKKPNENPNINITYELIDESLDKIDAGFEIQRNYNQKEYMNKINKNETHGTLNDFVNEIGRDNTNISETIILNENGNGAKSLDKQYNTSDFFQSATNDGIILNQVDMKVSLYNMDEYESFINKFGYAFEDDIIKYDGNALQALNKSGKYKDLIDGALKENPEQFMEFITNAKEVLDNIKEPNEFFNDYANYFQKDIKTMKRLINQNKDFINAEYDKIVKEIPIEKYKDIKLWKKDVAESLARAKQINAKETMAISNAINKQKMLYDYDSFYTDGISNDYLAKNKVELKSERVNDFNNFIKPFFDSGIFKTVEGEPIEITFAKFINDLKSTRRSAKWTAEGEKSIGDLRGYFNEGEMKNFFTSKYNKQFLKTNAEYIRDVFDYQTTKSARFLQFGTTSPYVVANRFKHDLPSILSDKFDKALSDAEKSVLNKAIIHRADTMIRNTHLGYIQPLQTPVEKTAHSIINGLYRGILSGTGLAEYGVNNYYISSMRSLKYGNINANTTKFNTLRMIKSLGQENLPNKEFNLAYLRKNIDLEKMGKDLSKLDKLDRVLFAFQTGSEKQLKNFGEINACADLFYLNKDYTKLSNEMKSVLRVNGINESNYGIFVDFTKEHINNKGLTIDIDTLSKQVEDGNFMADALRTIYYKLSDYYGNVKHGDKFKDKTLAGDLFSRMYGMFRNTSRSLNEDTFKRMMYYVDADGIAKTRFSSEYVKSGRVPKDLALFTQGAIFLGIAGYGYNIAKELIYSDKTLDQRLAVIETKNKELVDTFKEIPQGEIVQLIDWYANNTELMNPTETSDFMNNVAKKFGHIFDTLTDEEKRAFGTNKEEATKEFGEFIVKYFVSNTAYKVGKSIYKYSELGDVGSLDKVYGFTKEQQAEYESIVRNMEYDDIKKWNETMSRMSKSTVDFMQNDTRSFDTLPKQERDLAHNIREMHPELKEINDNEYKAEVAYVINTNPNNEQEALKEHFMSEYKVNVSNEVNSSFEKVEEPKEEKKVVESELTEKQLKFLNNLLDAQHKKLTNKEIEKFKNTILSTKDIKERKELLKKHYNIIIK